MTRWLFFAAIPLMAQTPAPQPQDVTVHVTVVWPEKPIISSKYGISGMPKGLYLAEVTAFNEGSQALSIGQSQIIEELLKNAGLVVYPRVDAVAVLGGRQARTWKARLAHWGYYTLLVTAEVALSGAIHFSPSAQSKVSVGLGVATSVDQILNAAIGSPLNTYDRDGMSEIVTIPPHMGVTGTVLTSTPPQLPIPQFDVHFMLTPKQVLSQ